MFFRQASFIIEVVKQLTYGLLFCAFSVSWPVPVRNRPSGQSTNLGKRTTPELMHLSEREPNHKSDSNRIILVQPPFQSHDGHSLFIDQEHSFASGPDRSTVSVKNTILKLSVITTRNILER